MIGRPIKGGDTAVIPGLESETLEFEKNRRRVESCPCGKSNRDGKFVPYVGHDDFGYCHSCTQTFLPQRDAGRPDYMTPRPAPRPAMPASHVPPKIFRASLAAYDRNHFAAFLIRTFGETLAGELIARYFVGTSKGGKTVFWQIDMAGMIRAGKVMLYDPETGRRSKTVDPNWWHFLAGMKDYNLKQCLFGEHLLADRTKPVALVEAEKTAIIASGFMPQFIWLATGGKGAKDAKDERLPILKGRTVTMFPDTNAFAEWSAIAARHGFRVSDLLERKATEAEKSQGLDIADYLFLQKRPSEQPRKPRKVADLAFEEPPPSVHLPEPLPEINALPMYPADWDSPEPLPEYPASQYENRKLAFLEKHAQTIADFALAFDFEMSAATIRPSNLITA